MKAFSPDIFNEQTTSDIIKESNSIVKPTEKSLIEFKTDCIRTENELRRNFYKRYITESCDNVVMEKILMDCEINAIHESYNEYAKTHKSDSVLLESGILSATSFDDNISIDGCIQAYELEIESSIYTAIQEEAKIFAESDISDKERFEKLQVVNEALGEKIKAAWEKIIAMFEQVFQQFIQKMKNANTVAYCKKYEKVILEKPFKEEDKFTTQDLWTGYNRVAGFNVPILELDKDGEQLDSVDTYIDKVLKDIQLGADENDAVTEYNNNKSLETFNGILKSYFCMKNHPMTYSGPQFEEILKDKTPKLYDCLTTYMPNLQNKILKEIRNMKRMCSAKMEEYGKTPNNEAVYSQIFQSYLILENDVIKEADEENNAAEEKTQAQQQTTTTQQTTTQTAGNNTGEETPNKKTPAGGIIPNRCATYTKVATSILRVELSAIEFIRSETMKAVRYHVRQYIGNDEYNKEQNNAQPQQNNNQQKQ